MTTRKVQTRPHQTSVNSPQAVGYVRVSTVEQATEGISLDTQKAKIRAYCELNGLTLVNIFEDAGKSAKNTKRDGLQELLLLVKSKQIQP